MLTQIGEKRTISTAMNGVGKFSSSAPLKIYLARVTLVPAEKTHSAMFSLKAAFCGRADHARNH